MQVLLVCLVLFFVASELYQWIQGLTLPLPLLVASGTALAIASNLRSLSVPLWKGAAPLHVGATLLNPSVSEPLASQTPGVQLPNFSPQVQPVSGVNIPSAADPIGGR